MICTFQDSMRLPVYRWFRYAAGFSGRWAREAIASRRPGIVFDPFAGTATALLAGEEEGVASFGFEAQPFVFELGKARLARFLPEELEELARRTFRPGPTARVDFLTRCYDDETFARLAGIREAVRENPAGRFALTAILRRCSRAGVSLYVLPGKSKVRVAEPFAAFREKLLEMARLYRFGRRGTLRHVVIPSVTPAFVQSCLAAIGLCWKAVVAAEVIGVPRLAVGSRIYEAKIYLETDALLAWTVTIVLLSVLLEALLRRLMARYMEVRHG